MGALPSYKTAPQISLTSPPSAAQGVPQSSSVSATFDMPLDPATINADNFLVSGQGGDRSGTVSYDPLTHKATFTPDAPFDQGEMVTARLTSKIANLWDVALDEDYIWDFEITTGTGVEEPDPGSIPGGFALFQNYPNPFNAETIIEYQIPHALSRAEKTDVILEIFNALGQRVRILVDERQAPGRHTLNWDGRDLLARELPSGIYFCRLEAGGHLDVRKLVLLR